VVEMKNKKATEKGNKFIALVIAFYLVSLSGSLTAKELKYDKLRKGWKTRMTDLGSEENYSTAFDGKRLSILPDMKLDLVINIIPNFGISLGSGFIAGSNRVNWSLSHNFSGTTSQRGDYTGVEDQNSIRDYKITAIPLNLGFYFFLPMKKSGKFTFSGHAGVGYYIGKLTHDVTYDLISEINFVDGFKGEHNENESINEEAKCNSLGIYGGLGLEMKMSSAISLGVELFGRYVNFKNWKGDRSVFWEEKGRYKEPGSGQWNEYTDTRSYDYHGYWWTYETPGENRDYTNMWLLKNGPSGEYFKNTRKTSINLNTLGLLFSIKFHFDLF